MMDSGEEEGFPVTMGKLGEMASSKTLEEVKFFRDEGEMLLVGLLQ